MRLNFIFIAGLLLLGCARLEESKNADQVANQPPDQVIWNGRIEVMENGKLHSLIHAGQIRTYEKKKETLLDSGVVVDFFNKLGQHTSQLTSRQAQVQEAKNFFLASGDVVVTSDSGAQLKTERLFWDKEKQRIRSDTLVVMVSLYDSLQGFDFEANEDLTSWQLQRPTGKTFRRVKK